MLKNTDNISIYQDYEDKNNFLLISNKYGRGEDIKIELDIKERERLELSLISADEVEVDGFFSDFYYHPNKSTLKIPLLNMNLKEIEIMNQAIVFEEFFEQREYISFTDDYHSRLFNDYDDFFVRKIFKMYCVPNEMDLDNYIFEANHDEIAKTLDLVATIDLTLVLNAEMKYLDVDPLFASDAISGDLLESVYQLSSSQGPLSYEYGDPFQNVILINDIHLEKILKY